MTYLTLGAAYGRSYASARQLLADWRAGKDFAVVTTGDLINAADTRGEQQLIACYRLGHGHQVVVKSRKGDRLA